MIDGALTPAQEIYCQHRAEGATVAEAVAQAGVNPATGTRWNRLAEVQRRIEALQEPLRQGAMVKLCAQAERAARTMLELLDEDAAAKPGAATRLRAATAVLDRIGVGVEQRVTVVEPSMSAEEAYRRIRAIAAQAEARRQARITEEEGEDGLVC